MGRSPYSFAGHNLVTMLRTQGGRGERPDRRVLQPHLLGRAGASGPPTRPRRRRRYTYIRSQQLSNGGFGWAPGTGADSNDTAAAMMALRSISIPCTLGDRTRAASDYLHALHNSDNGYSLNIDGASDSQSTAWVVQARNACCAEEHRRAGLPPARQLPSGAYNYQKGRTVTPAWVTAQVLPAVNGRHYPIRP